MKRKRRPAQPEHRLTVLENNVRWRDLYRADGELAEMELEMAEQIQRITENGNGGTVIVFEGIHPVRRHEVSPSTPRRRRRKKS